MFVGECRGGKDASFFGELRLDENVDYPHIAVRLLHDLAQTQDILLRATRTGGISGNVKMKQGSRHAVSTIKIRTERASRLAILATQRAAERRAVALSDDQPQAERKHCAPRTAREQEIPTELVLRPRQAERLCSRGRSVSSPVIPRSRAQIIAALRRLTPIFRYKAAIWFRTVLRDRPSVSLISLSD